MGTGGAVMDSAADVHWFALAWLSKDVHRIGVAQNRPTPRRRGSARIRRGDAKRSALSLAWARLQMARHGDGMEWLDSDRQRLRGDAHGTGDGFDMQCEGKALVGTAKRRVGGDLMREGVRRRWLASLGCGVGGCATRRRCFALLTAWTAKQRYGKAGQTSRRFATASACAEGIATRRLGSGWRR